jgi:hypothetical protein
MKFKLFLSLCILQFSNFLFAGDKNEGNKNLVIGPKIEKALLAIELQNKNEKLHMLAHNRLDIWDPDVVKFEIDPVTLAQIGESKFITKKKSESSFIPDSRKYIYFKTISTDNNEIYFFTYYEEKDETYYLFYQLADKNNVPLAKPVKISKHKNFGSTDFTDDYRLGSFEVGINKSKSIVYLINQEPHKVINKKKEEYSPGVVTISYYDVKDMKEINTATYDLSITNFHEFAFIGNNGMMYSLVKKFYKEEINSMSIDGKPKKQEKIRWFYKVIGLNVNKPEEIPIETTIALKDQYVFHVKLQLDENGEIFCAGTKSNKAESKNPEKLNGIFTCNLNSKTLEVANYREIRIEDQIINCLKGDETEEPNYRIIGVEKFDNGTSTFLLEENVNYIEYVETKNSSYRSRFYYHGNIMICNVGTNNKINWINNLLRNEYHQRDYAYFYFKRVGNSINFVFIDSKSNYDKTTLKFNYDINKMELPKVFELERIAIAKVDENGNQLRRLADNSDLGFDNSLKGVAWSNSGKEFYFTASSGINYNKIVKVLFD